jgi:PPOX class probable FMN-dependent enzyme
VVFRGFLEGSDRLKFVTDARSKKIEQIEHQPWAEACWYFPNTREQFRIAGCLKIVAADCSNADLLQARQNSWQEMSDAARLQFTWPHPSQSRGDAAAFEAPAPNSVEPLPHFCLLLLEPVQVDRLELRGEPQNRTIYKWSDRDCSWSTQAVNP